MTGASTPWLALGLLLLAGLALLRRPLGQLLRLAVGKQGVGHGRLLSRGRAGAEGAREPLYPEGMNSLDKYSKL